MIKEYTMKIIHQHTDYIIDYVGLYKLQHTWLDKIKNMIIELNFPSWVLICLIPPFPSTKKGKEKSKKETRKTRKL